MIRRIVLSVALSLVAAPVLAGGPGFDFPHLSWPQKPVTGDTTTSAANSR